MPYTLHGPSDGSQVQQGQENSRPQIANGKVHCDHRRYPRAWYDGMISLAQFVALNTKAMLVMREVPRHLQLSISVQIVVDTGSSLSQA